jgi:hypothetical protein
MISNDTVNPGFGDDFFQDGVSVRCFKNFTGLNRENSDLKYRWQTGSTCSSDESDYTSTSRDSYDETNTTATATVTTS